jgi:hypothetical protein
MRNHIAVITVNVVSETPALGHGDTEDNPKPAPNASSRSSSAAMTKAPPKTAPQETPEVELAAATADWPVLPGTSTTTVSIPPSVPNQGKDQDHRNRNTQKPK